MDIGSIRYQKNFINKVVFRIDFLEFINTEEIFTNDVVSAIKKYYPTKGIDQVMRFNIINWSTVDAKTQGQMIEGLQQTFFSSDGGGKLVLNNKSLIIEIDNYQTFTEFITSFRSVIYALFRIKKISTERIGIRFINIFNNDPITIRKKFFVSSISSSLDIPIAKNSEELVAIRSITLTEYRIDNIILNFRFGRINLQYPKAIKSTDFTLDFDCYTSEGLQSAEEILNFLNKGHIYIQNLFESSITDSLRQEMGYNE